MIEEQPISFPSEDERLRRKKILEKSFVDNAEKNEQCPEKSLYAIREGILILEPVWIDWESDDWPEWTIEFAPGYDMSSLTPESEKIKLVPLTFWQKLKQQFSWKAL
jgi:hypothetical protein